MGRPKSFQEEEILGAAARAFTVGGYEGTSIDDLVKALNIHRGSLYKAFGSKRGLFVAVLRQYVRVGLATAVQTIQDDDSEADLFAALANHSDLDLLLVAALERGHQDAEVTLLVRQALGLLENLLSQNRVRPEGHAAPPVDWLTSRSPPSQSIRLMGARLYERLLIDVKDQDNSPDLSGKARDGTNQH